MPLRSGKATASAPRGAAPQREERGEAKSDDGVAGRKFRIDGAIAATLEQMASKGASPDQLTGFLQQQGYGRTKGEAEQIARAILAQRPPAPSDYDESSEAGSSSESEASSSGEEDPSASQAHDWMVRYGLHLSRADCIEGVIKATGGRLSEEQAGRQVDATIFRVPPGAKRWLEQSAKGKTFDECVRGLVADAGRPLPKALAEKWIRMELEERPALGKQLAASTRSEPAAIRRWTVDQHTEIDTGASSAVRKFLERIPPGTKDRVDRVAAKMIEWAQSWSLELDLESARILVGRVAARDAVETASAPNRDAAGKPAAAGGSTFGSQGARESQRTSAKGQALKPLRIGVATHIGPVARSKVLELLEALAPFAANSRERVVDEAIAWEKSRGYDLDRNSARILVGRIEAERVAQPSANAPAEPAPASPEKGAAGSAPRASRPEEARPRRPEAATASAPEFDFEVPLDEDRKIDLQRLYKLMTFEGVPATKLALALRQERVSPQEIFRAFRSPVLWQPLGESMKALLATEPQTDELLGAVLEGEHRYARRYRAMRMLLAEGYEAEDLRTRLERRFGFAPEVAAALTGTD